MDKLPIEKVKGLNSLRWSQGGETSIQDLMEYFKCDENSFDTIIKPYIDCGFISEWKDAKHIKRMFIIHINPESITT